MKTIIEEKSHLSHPERVTGSMEEGVLQRRGGEAYLM